MAHVKKHTTTCLPQSLVDEISAQTPGSTNSESGHRRTASNGFHSRKAERKAERQLSKQRKARFFSHAVSKQSGKRSVVTETKENAPPRKKVKFEMPVDRPLPPPGDHKDRPVKSHGLVEHGKKKKATKSRGREPQSSLTRILTTGGATPKSTKKRSRAEEEEDAYIELLERKLRIKKDKKGKARYGSGFEGDGLLDLLVDLDEKLLDPIDDDLEQYANGQGDPDDEGGSADLSASEASEEEESDTESSQEEWTGFSPDTFETEDEKDEDAQSRDEPTSKANEASSGSKYVPPHLRKKEQSTGAEIDAKLVRQLKGLLNRLSEQNIDSILKEIEELYRSHRRHDITAALTNLIIEGTCSHSILLDSYVALHAGLVACLHKIIGIELAAYFVQNVVSNFERHYLKSKESKAPDAEEGRSGTTNDGVGKECSNLLVLLSDLYNYHVISCTLLYDIIRLILEGNLSELDIELVLKLARGSGMQLRQDDPSALKDIIQIVQSKLGEQSGASSRTRFMVETLINLKNNKLKKTAGSAQGGNESKERIGKFVAGIGKKYHVHAHEPLRITLDDLRQADSKGKWWLVGAAWGGDPLIDQQASLVQSTAAPEEKALVILAKKQGMNTDVRRSIFVVLMSSEDYVDACDRLTQLNLTEVQQREIIRVLLHCCGNERSYNPYYTLVADRLCRQKSHSHRVTLQYSFWDFLRNLGETNVGGAEMARDDGDDGEDEGEGFELDRISSTRIANVARAYSWLVAKGWVAITILKTVNFISLKAKTKTFLKQFFTHLFANTQDSSSVPSLGGTISPTILTRRDEKSLADVLVKATRAPALPLGILHFLSKTFPRIDEEDRNADPTDVFIRWCCEVAKDVLQDSAKELL